MNQAIVLPKMPPKKPNCEKAMLGMMGLSESDFVRKMKKEGKSVYLSEVSAALNGGDRPKYQMIKKRVREMYESWKRDCESTHKLTVVLEVNALSAEK